MTDGVKRTVLAQKAIDLGELLNFRFEKKAVGRDVPKRLSVVTLETQSTDGGKMARQSIVLSPLEEGVQGSVMCGWVDVARREAEIRDHGLVAAQFSERYRLAFDVGAGEYEALLGELQATLAHQGFTITRARFVAPGRMGGEPGEGLLRGIAWVVLGCVVGLGIAYLLG